MLGKAHNPSTRIVQDGPVCLRAALLALFGALILAGSANAAAFAPSGEPVEQASDAAPISGEEGVKETPVSPDPGEAEAVQQAPEGSSTGPGPEQPPAEGAPAESEPTGPGAEESPPIEQPPAETPPAEVPIEQAPAEVPPTGPGGEGPVEPAPPVAVEVTTPEPVLPIPPAEEAREPAPVASGTSATTDPPVAQQGAIVHASEPAVEASSAPIGSLAAVSTVGVRTGEGPPPPATGVASVGEPAGLTAMQMTGDFSCELSALGGRTTDNCTAGWLGNQRFISSSSSVGLAPAAVVSLAAAVTAVAPTRGVHGNSAVGSTPVSPPAPGPAPSGKLRLGDG